MTCNVLALAAAALIGGAMLSAGALAQQPAYVGTWASKPAQCRLSQGGQHAPLIMRRDGYDQHETHCRFSNIRAKGRSTWRLRAACSVQGDRQTLTLTLTVSKNRLTIRNRYGRRTLTRCR
jgi:hypothetical protein